MTFIIFLLLFSTVTTNTDIFSETNFGRSFVAFWPENIAHYYPVDASNQIHVMALHDGTKVTIQLADSVRSLTANAGVSLNIPIGIKRELRKQDVSNIIFQITSNLDVVVHVVSSKAHSMQIVLLMPNDKFATKFFIPPVVSRLSDITDQVTERNSFRLFCVSGAQDTTVTVTGSSTVTVKLQANQIAQIVLQGSESVVTSDNPMAVFLSHPCIVQDGCVCSLLYTRLPPAQDQNLNFFIPPVLVKNASETFILKADGAQTQAQPFNADSANVESKGSAFLHRPGLLLPLIAEQDAAACYVVNGITDLINSVVIVVHKDKKAGVHIGSSSVAAFDWQVLKGTDYVSAEVEIKNGKNVIWHADATMAVYAMFEKEGQLVGTPAPIISKTPDVHGCAIEPEVIQVGDMASDWRESLEYCRTLDMDLLCFSSKEHRLQVNDFLSENHGGETNLWIGMRRSSVTGSWYWASGCPLVDVSWAADEPGGVQDGHCVMMMVEKDKEFTWRDEVCCKAAKPVCRSPVLLFPI